jgi:hypothetical protein
VVSEPRAKASVQYYDGRGVGQDEARGGLLAKQSEAERGYGELGKARVRCRKLRPCAHEREHGGNV